MDKQYGILSRFSFTKLPLEGAYLISSFYSSDIRGGFCKDFSKETFLQNGIDYDLKEVFYTYSHKGVIRALHFQRVKQQAKLVRCVKGRVYDVVCDLRKDSTTFKKWLGFELTEENHQELLVPEGFGHGYLVLEDSIVSYKCGEKFYGEYDDGIIWNDKTLDIEWPLELIGGEDKLILSDKDKNLSTFEEFLSKEF